MKNLLVFIIGITLSLLASAQACTPAGDQTTYGTANTWIGYIYDNPDFTNYSGYVNEGTVSSSNFDESFGGDYVNYPTNGCSVLTETFSARYKLAETFTANQYQFTVGGDDGYRLSIDGGATWIINQWNDQSYVTSTYTVTLSGTYNMVLEYYENGGGNRVSFSVTALCMGTENQSVYGTGNVWNGYIYKGMNFDYYSGLVTEGAAGNPNFDESFGGDNVLYNTSACAVQTEQFSARYRLQKNFPNANYVITAGGDDGYRLSIDGGSTWIINNWGDHGYTTTTYGLTMNGTYNLVLEYYENGGGNRVSFFLTSSLLPVNLLNFGGTAASKNISLNWKVSSELNTDYYQVEKSADGAAFSTLGKVYSISVNNGSDKTYSYADPSPFTGANYYRLRMVDKEGKYTYSPVIKIKFDDKKEIALFPSVVNHGPVWLSTSAALKNGLVQLFDMTGKKIQEIRLPSLLAAGQTTTLNFTNTGSGSYVLICKSGAEIKAKQIIFFK